MGVKEDKLRSLGAALQAKFEQYEKDRHALEQQWLKNYRQIRGVYDPDVLIPIGRSKVYPRNTHVKVLGFVAKVMELMFPANEKNYSVLPSPVPDIPEADIQAIIDGAQALAEEAGQPLLHADIEKAVFRFAEDRARAMERELDDQLTETDYPHLAKRALRSGASYGMGITKGPLVRFQTLRRWRMDEDTGRYYAETVEAPRPYYEGVRVWDAYPDLNARSWESMEGLFERLVFTRNDLVHLADDDRYFGKVIEDYLGDNRGGNYRRKSHEDELNNIRHVDNVSPNESGLYEVIHWYGRWAVKDLQNAGIETYGEDKRKDAMVDMWTLDGRVIRAELAAFGEKVSDMFHVFLFEDDEETGPTGVGLPEKIRDTQMKLCTIDRMTIDNAATSAGPVIEVNDDLIKKGQDTNTIHAFKVIHREGMGTEAGYPAVRDIRIESHVGELLEFRKDVVEQMDIESSLPSWLFGAQQQLGEAFRTSSNMSMMQGGATMVTKDIIRSFDRWIVSVVDSLRRWNDDFNDNPEIKGDYQVVARGTTSLVAKELRGQALDQFIATLSEEERMLLRTREVLIDRLQARDLPVDRVVDIDRAEQILAQFRQQGQQAAQQQGQVAEAEARKINTDAAHKEAQIEQMAATAPVQNAEALSRMELNEASAEVSRDHAQNEAVGQMLDALLKEGQLAQSAQL